MWLKVTYEEEAEDFNSYRILTLYLKSIHRAKQGLHH